MTKSIVNAGLVLLSAGREPIRVRDQERSGRAGAGMADDIAHFLGSNWRRRDGAKSRMADRIGGPKGEQ